MHVCVCHINFYVHFFHSKENAGESIIYSYNKVINGFAAMLEEEDAAKIAGQFLYL